MLENKTLLEQGETLQKLKKRLRKRSNQANPKQRILLSKKIILLLTGKRYNKMDTPP